MKLSANQNTFSQSQQASQGMTNTQEVIPADHITLSAWHVLFLAMACCLILANMYAAQPIISEIAQTIGINKANSGVVITVAQIGYCAGVLLLVPLGDALENRKLITILFGSVAIALFAISQASTKGFLLCAFLVLGLSASMVQIIIPYSANLIADAQKGKMIGFIVSGASLGIVLGRPVSSMLTELWGWQITYLVSSVLLLIIGLLFRILLPTKAPSQAKLSYIAIISSMTKLFLSLPRLRLHIFMMTLIFTGFTLFWSTVPMVLQNELHYSHAQIAMFSLVSLAAPICVIIGGILADKGYRLFIVGMGAVMTLGAFIISPIFGISTLVLVLAVVLLDSGMNMANVFIQQSVLMMRPEARSRLNALCVSISFMGGALGSFMGPWVYEHYGWYTTSVIGSVLCTVAIFIFIKLKSKQYRI